MCRWTLGNVPNSRQSLKELLSPQFCGLRWVQTLLWLRVRTMRGIVGHYSTGNFSCSFLPHLSHWLLDRVCRICGTSCSHWTTACASHPVLSPCHPGSFCREGNQGGFRDQEEQQGRLVPPECHWDVCCSLGAGMGLRGSFPLSMWPPGSVSFLQLLGKIRVTKDNEYPIERREIICYSLEYCCHILLEPPFQTEEPQSALSMLIWKLLQRTLVMMYRRVPHHGQTKDLSNDALCLILHFFSNNF